MTDKLLVYPNPSKDNPTALTPLSILYPGAYFESQCESVAYWDERFDDEDELVELIKSSKEIGVSAFTGHQCKQAANILIKAKRINPSIICSVGGHHARILPEQVLAEPFVDKIYTERYGEELFPYNSRTRKHFERTTMQYSTSRGCPSQCRFCSISDKWVDKCLEKVERELKFIHYNVGFKCISFSDPNIAFPKDRVNRIKQLGKIMRDLDVKWDGCMRSPYMTEEMADALEDSNCDTLELGCESGNEQFLRQNIRKGHGVEAIKNAAKVSAGRNFSILYSFIANMPHETKEQLNDTLDLIDWIKETDSNARISIFNYAPFPGSEMYNEAVELGFKPPTTMKEWGERNLMSSPIYWIAGLNFRDDKTRENFPGEDYEKIRPYVELAEQKWRDRDIDEFPVSNVEGLIEGQIKR